VADLIVSCRGGHVSLFGKHLEEGRASVSLDTPIDLIVNGWSPRDLPGHAADGRAVTLRVAPSTSHETPLDVAILVDRSGSMSEKCSSFNNVTKHQALTLGLLAASKTLSDSDHIELWQFNNSADRIGATHGVRAKKSIFSFANQPQQDFRQLVGRLSSPEGGTDIGLALSRVISDTSSKDLLLVTDGKSHELDVQALARSGRRISVMLVGEDSLEANVGHLAALTGGEIFVSVGSDSVDALLATLQALRFPASGLAPDSSRPEAIAARRGGMLIRASWFTDSHAQGPVRSDPAVFEGRAVAAVAASLALPALDTEAATTLAEAEGLVTHLTSLVLVDQEGRVQEGLPGTRKVPLPLPATAPAPRLAQEACEIHGMLEISAIESTRSLPQGSPAVPPPPKSARVMHLAREASSLRELSGRITELANAIDWDLAPDQIQAGDLSILDHDIVRGIQELASRRSIVALSNRLGLDPIVLVIGLAAREAATQNRSAARVAKAIFHGKDLAALAKVMRAGGGASQ
jgi:hypothetical protein